MKQILLVFSFLLRHLAWSMVKALDSFLLQEPPSLPAFYHDQWLVDALCIFTAAIRTSPLPLPALLMSKGIRESEDKENKEITLCSAVLCMALL